MYKYLFYDKQNYCDIFDKFNIKDIYYNNIDNSLHISVSQKSNYFNQFFNESTSEYIIPSDVLESDFVILKVVDPTTNTYEYDVIRDESNLYLVDSNILNNRFVDYSKYITLGNIITNKHLFYLYLYQDFSFEKFYLINDTRFRKNEVTDHFTFMFKKNRTEFYFRFLSHIYPDDPQKRLGYITPEGELFISEKLIGKVFETPINKAFYQSYSENPSFYKPIIKKAETLIIEHLKLQQQKYIVNVKNIKAVNFIKNMFEPFVTYENDKLKCSHRYFKDMIEKMIEEREVN